MEKLKKLMKKGGAIFLPIAGVIASVSGAILNSTRDCKVVDNYQSILGNSTAISNASVQGVDITVTIVTVITIISMTAFGKMMSNEKAALKKTKADQEIAFKNTIEEKDKVIEELEYISLNGEGNIVDNNQYLNRNGLSSHEPAEFELDEEQPHILSGSPIPRQGASIYTPTVLPRMPRTPEEAVQDNIV